MAALWFINLLSIESIWLDKVFYEQKYRGEEGQFVMS